MLNWWTSLLTHQRRKIFQWIKSRWTTLCTMRKQNGTLWLSTNAIRWRCFTPTLSWRSRRLGTLCGWLRWFPDTVQRITRAGGRSSFLSRTSTNDKFDIINTLSSKLQSSLSYSPLLSFWLGLSFDNLLLSLRKCPLHTFLRAWTQSFLTQMTSNQKNK